MSSISVAASGSGPATPERSSDSAPLIEASGVRSSWLTVETNSAFIRSVRRSSLRSAIRPVKVRAPSTRWDETARRTGNRAPSARTASTSIGRPRMRAWPVRA